MTLRHTKGQSALEFLMTYGWAILVVLAAIGALAYFGVLDPGKYLPDKCVASTGLACLGTRMSSGQVAVTISAGTGTDLVLKTGDIKLSPIMGAGVGQCSDVWVCDKGINDTVTPDASCNDNSAAADITLVDGRDYTIVSTCNLVGMSQYKIKYSFQYIDGKSGLPVDAFFDASGKVR